MASLGSLRRQRNRLVGNPQKSARRHALNQQIASRKSKLSVPAVNHNPQPPNAQSLQQKIAAQQAQREREIPNPTFSPEAPLDPSQVQQDFQGQQSDPQSWFAPSSYQSKPNQPDPRDSEYWTNVTKLAFGAEQDYAGNLQQQSYADTDYQKQLEQANVTEGQNVRGIGEDAMRSGLAYSGYANRTQAEEAQRFGSQMEDAQTAKYREDQAREVARNAILQGYSVDEAAALAQATVGYAQGKLTEATSGAPENRPSEVARATKVLKQGKRKPAPKQKPRPRTPAPRRKVKPMKPRRGRHRRRHRGGRDED